MDLDAHARRMIANQRNVVQAPQKRRDLILEALAWDATQLAANPEHQKYWTRRRLARLHGVRDSTIDAIIATAEKNGMKS